jgi:hypothetical protein
MSLVLLAVMFFTLLLLYVLKFEFFSCAKVCLHSRDVWHRGVDVSGFAMSACQISHARHPLRNNARRIHCAGVKCPATILKVAAAAGALSGTPQYVHATLSLLRAGNGTKARACLAHVFQAARAERAGDSLAWAWGALGELIRVEGAPAAHVEALFERAAGEGPGTGVMPPFSFDILGPFSVGKMEYDGDPLEAAVHGGVKQARSSITKRFPSEYADGGFVGWQVLHTGAYSGFSVDVSFAHVQWNKHVQLTNSMPILEWQSWAVADFLVTNRGLFRVACEGVHTFSIDDVGRPWYAGDIYRSGLFWAAVALEPGVHSIFAKVKAKVQTSLRCHVKPIDGSSGISIALLVIIYDILSLHKHRCSARRSPSMLISS